MNNNKKYLILSIFGIIFMFFGGTLSYWQWESSTSEQTSVTFTVENNFKCSVDGGGDITSSNITLAPSTCTNSKYAIKREITTNVEITGSNMSVLMDLWLDVNSIDPELKNSTNFKYAITTKENSCTDGYINGGTFTGDEAILLNDKIYSNTKEDTYYLYIWLDSAETNSNTQNKTFSLSLNGSCTSGAKPYTESILNGADPVLEPGMIPVTIANDGKVTTANLTQEWYNYTNKEWANAVLVSSANRANYYESDGVTIKQNQPIPETDILAYYVWIPRYKYQIWTIELLKKTSARSINIVFEPGDAKITNGNAINDYITHPAFIWGDKTISGLWVGKFETTGSVELPTIKPLSTPLAPGLNVSEAFKMALNFAGGKMNDTTGEITYSGNNTYGLTSKTNSHMIKNSEWGAVAYLSHSVYGINGDMGFNSYYIETDSDVLLQTGCGAENEEEYYSTTCEIAYGTEETNIYRQSTTGNISGVYDMSGGAFEQIMGRYSDLTNDKSGFNILPENKYYNIYSGNFSYMPPSYINENCTLQTCGGHALYEIVSWDSSFIYFVNSSSPWFMRGGTTNMAEYISIFSAVPSDGSLTGVIRMILLNQS